MASINLLLRTAIAISSIAIGGSRMNQSLQGHSRFTSWTSLGIVLGPVLGRLEFTDISRYYEHDYSCYTPYVEVPNLPVDVASALTRSLDYTFISFERAACYGRDKLTPKRRTSISCTLQEVVTGEPR